MTQVETVRGPVDSAALGRTYMHEHIFVLTPDVQQNYPDEWGDEDSRVDDAVQKLNELATRGVSTIVDPTVIGLGRYIPRIQRIAAQVPDLNIVVATGCYTYGDVPFFFHYRGPALEAALGQPVPDPMVDMFVGDITEGIAGTGVKAGMLKCAIDEQGMTGGVERVMRAVAKAHRRTGTPITIHTHPGSRQGLAAKRVLDDEGVDPRRVVLGHSGDSSDADHLQSLAEAGFVLGMDRFGINLETTFEARADTVVEMCRRLRREHGAGSRCGLLHRLDRAVGPGCHTPVALPAHYRRRVAVSARQGRDRRSDRDDAHRESAPDLRERGTVLMPSHAFDDTGVTPDHLGVKHYAELPSSVVAMLRSSVERDGDAEAVVVLDGPRVSYAEVWDRSARVAGGLRVPPASTTVTGWPSAAVTASTGCWPSSAL